VVVVVAMYWVGRRVLGAVLGKSGDASV
jgi:hypothetical protein